MFIPAALPPHKRSKEVIEAGHRLEMVKLATKTQPVFSVSEVELERSGKSYSVDTIRYFRERHGDSLFFILGRDAFDEIETWKNYPDLFTLAHFIVMVKPGFKKTRSASHLPRALTPMFRFDPRAGTWIHRSRHTLRFQEITFLDISSTKIREYVKKGRSITYLVPSEVETYIEQQRLYRRGR